MEEFKELIIYTVTGYVIGLFLAFLFDYLGIVQNPIVEWMVRVFSGEGESIFEGIYAIKQRFKKKSLSMAEAYGWGKFIGMTFPWFVDFISRLLGVDVYSWQGFYIPYLYAMSDQIGANISGFIYIRRKEGALLPALRSYFKNPVMLTSLLVVLIVPLGLLIVRVLGFSPDKNVLVALETIAANLCWLPPLVGFIFSRK